MSRARAKEARAPSPQQQMTHNMMTRSKTRAAAKVEALLTCVLNQITSHLNKAETVNKMIRRYKPKIEFNLRLFQNMDGLYRAAIVTHLIKEAVEKFSLFPKPRN